MAPDMKTPPKDPGSPRNKDGGKVPAEHLPPGASFGQIQMARRAMLAPMELNKDLHYHFLGVGGVGMSALAAIMHRRGHRVSGSDSREGRTLERLRAEGIRVHMGHNAEALREAGAVVYSTAIGPGHPVWAEVERLGLPRHHRSQVLGALAGERRTLAVTGTHGKTTSSAALSHVLLEAGWSPTVLVGGDVPQLSGVNHHIGQGEWMVCEADESDGSFLNLTPAGILLTNIEADHLDQHGSLDNLVTAFEEFLGRIRPGGWLSYCCDDPLAARLGYSLEKTARITAESYGMNEEAQVRVHLDSMKAGEMHLSLYRNGSTYRLRTQLAGRQNALNLAGVFSLACQAGIEPEQALRALAGFQGVARRQQFVGKIGSLLLFDDYAHHPTEVAVTVEQFLATHGEPLTVVFQPHLYSRTAQFADEFARALKPATRVFVTEVYGAREQPIAGVSGKMITMRLNEELGHRDSWFVADWEELARLVREGEITTGTLLTLGAGNITELGPFLLDRTKQDPPAPHASQEAQ
ncbi:MAG: UDP-N-acetylmuramate--L-alanine ligase [Deltaproteobacteria bacterium]|nr:UDP-N-acetylmuramate--L-alanine ligase [Deltaproteobacteria bacterium]